MFFTAAHSVILLIFAVTLVFAAITVVVDLRKISATYNARLFPFGYFSLGAWTLWLLQYFFLAAPLLYFPRSFSLDSVRSLALIQNAFWAVAVLAVYREGFSRKSRTLPALGIFSLLVGLAGYERVLTAVQVAKPIGAIDGLPTATAFVVLGVLIVKLRYSKIPAAIFIAHGITQWLWTWNWLTSFNTSPVVQLGFPLWHGVLLIAWMKLISEMVQRTRPAEEKFALPANPKVISDKARTELEKSIIPIRVMISSTVGDLIPEREAAERAIVGLNLERFRAETFGSVPQPPEIVCAFMAEQCDIFLLIIGKRCGYKIESQNKSVVEFEYDTAFAEDPKKILVYVKQGVKRERLLLPFLNRVENYHKGFFRSEFKTPDELHDKVRNDISRWLAARIRH